MNQILKEIDTFQKEINSFRPLSDNILKQLKEYYKIGLTYTSNALEGNSLTETETKIVLEDGITIGGKPVRDFYEAMGHAQAYDLIYEIAKNKKSFNEEDIKQLHKLFYYRIDEKNAGAYRKEKVIITGSKYACPNPSEIPNLMKKLIKNLSREKGKLHPVEFAAQAHKEFVFIHPFVDGNGRVARLLMNLALLQADFVIAIIPPVLRVEYIQALENARVDDKPFMNFIAGRVKETQKDYLRLLKK